MAERGSNSRPLGTFRSKRYITKPPRPVSYQCDINATHNIENTTRSSNFIDLVYACLEIFKDKYGEPKTVSIIALRFLNFLTVNAYEILHFAFEYTTSKKNQSKFWQILQDPKGNALFVKALTTILTKYTKNVTVSYYYMLTVHIQWSKEWSLQMHFCYFKRSIDYFVILW